MLHQIFPLTEDGRVTLSTYLFERSTVLWNNKDKWEPDKRPAVIVCPGGGYWFLSQREGEPVALSFMQQGFQAFVLHYSLKEHSAFPAPLEDVSKAVWFVRSHAEEWNIDPDKIAIGGFSAGGHISALLGTQWNTSGLCERLNIPEGGNKPNAMFMSYAPTEIFEADDSNKEAYEDINGIGDLLRYPVPEIKVINYVGSHTPPTFIWHTRKDMLHCTQSMHFAEELYKNDIPFELHVFNEGPHGMSLSSPLVSYGYDLPTNVGEWFPLCVNFFKKILDF